MTAQLLLYLPTPSPASPSPRAPSAGGGETSAPQRGSGSAVKSTDPDAAFRAWLERYPWVPQVVIRELRADLLAGRRLSVKAIVEDLRNGRRNSAHDGEWSWNNNYTSRLNRLVGSLDPELRQFLETRRLTK